MKNQPEDNVKRSPEQDVFQRWSRPAPIFLSLAAFPTVSRPVLIGAWSLAITASVIAETWMWTKGMSLTNSNWVRGLIPIGAVIYFSALNSMLGTMKQLATIRLLTERASVKAVRKTEQLQDNLQDDFFTNLVKINFKYIDQYYLQTQLRRTRASLYV